MATRASRQTTGVTNYAKPASVAGTTAIVGGVKMTTAGTRSGIGMITITTTKVITVESVLDLKQMSFRSSVVR
jgi:hypothetical protein